MTPKERATKILAADRFATTSGIVLVDADKDHAVCRMEIADSHLNAAGGVQGGAIFTLADTAFGMAANAEGKLTVSLSNAISYLKSTSGKALIATARKVSATKRTCVYEVEVTDDLGELIAKMTGTGYIKSERIAE